MKVPAQYRQAVKKYKLRIAAATKREKLRMKRLVKT